MSYHPDQRRNSGFSALKIRLLIAGAIVLFSLVGYLTKAERNQITGELQRVGGMTVDEEIQLGMQSVNEMAYRHRGPSEDLRKTAIVQRMGQRLVASLQAHLEKQNKRLPYRFYFHLLADKQTVNAFALPGGQVFITEALFDKFGRPVNGQVDRVSPEGQFAMQGQLAGVLGHEIGHVIERHGAQRMAKSRLLSGMVGAAGVAGGDMSSAQVASMVGNLITVKYGRNDEYESDKWGVLLMVMSGYNPDHMLEVMDILEASSGGGGQPEFLSTHPLPKNRKQHIESIKDEFFKDGLPPGLK